MDYKELDNYDLIIETQKLGEKILKNLISMMVLMGMVFLESIISFFTPIPFWIFVLTMFFCYGMYLVHYFIYNNTKKKYNQAIEEIKKRKLD